MKRIWKTILPVICIASTVGVCQAQIHQPEPSRNVIQGTVAAIGYPVGAAGTKINMMGTSAASQSSGEAKVTARAAGTEVELKVAGLPHPTTLGAQFLTYVLWTVTPDGTTTNLGEVLVNKDGSGKIDASAQSQTFAMIVTAEPYYAVRMPSDVIVLENDPRTTTKVQIYPQNSYKLMKNSEYALGGNPLALEPDLKKLPLDVYEARNAVEIAKLRGAEHYAPKIFAQAQACLQTSERAVSQTSNKNQLLSVARQTIQFAEDSRALSAQRQELERIELEKEVAAAAAAAKAKAEAEAQAALEAKRQEELTAAREAQMAAEAAAKAAEQKAQAAAEQAVLEAKAQAATDEAARAQTATAELRATLLQQLNDVLKTTDTPKGLVVHMADVLFNVGKYSLSNDAQLKLAKLSGIIQAHPGLNLAIEGYTDTTGTNAINMTLSQQRADATRGFLVAQGLASGTITAQGLGPADPIADNSSVDGRKQNRRVEIIVSGQIIGVNIGK